MPSIINSTSTGAGGLISTGNTDNTLVIQTGDTTAISIGANQAVVLSGNLDVVGSTTVGSVFVEDNIINRPVLEDYAIEGVAIGNTGATRTIDLTTGNFFSATLDQACTFTFSNPAASGDFCGFSLALTNGGAFAITYPVAVDWPGGSAPTLTASGLDLLVFLTYDGGTTWLGLVAGLDIKSP